MASSESWLEMSGREQRRYSVPSIAAQQGGDMRMAEDLHAWSIYRQNLNSDFADSALGSSMKAPLPYGNFQLDSSTSKAVSFASGFRFFQVFR